jgi:hypothetical protein
MIIWGSGSGHADVGQGEHKHCDTCEKERPFSVFLQYRYAHLYYLRWVTEKNTTWRAKYAGAGGS